MVIGAINMLVDITDRHQAERAVAHLAAIVMSSEDAVISKDLQGIVSSWNRQRKAVRIYGGRNDRTIGESAYPSYRPMKNPPFLTDQRGERIDHYETIRRRKDGTDFHISLTVSPLTDLHGRVIGASKIVRNITEQKRVEEALLQRDEALTNATTP